MMCVWKATVHVSVATAVYPVRSSKTDFVFRFHENVIFDLHLDSVNCFDNAFS